VTPDGNDRVPGGDVNDDRAATDLKPEIAGRTWTAIERAHAEAALHESERQLAKELAGARTLQQVSTELMSESEPLTLYVKLVDAATALMRADAGSIQMLEGDGSLRLLASRHFDAQSDLHWHSVSVDSSSTCGLALARKERIVVSDVEASDIMAGTSDLDEYRRSRLRAVQSTPLVSRDGRAVGVLSTHWHDAHEPQASEFAPLRRVGPAGGGSPRPDACTDGLARARGLADGPG
jgi:GAF domain-containing protein